MNGHDDITVEEIDDLIRDAMAAQLHDPSCAPHRAASIKAMRLEKLLLTRTTATNALLSGLAGTMKVVQEDVAKLAEVRAQHDGPSISIGKGAVMARGWAAIVVAFAVAACAILYGGLGLKLYLGQKQIKAELSKAEKEQVAMEHRAEKRNDNERTP